LTVQISHHRILRVYEHLRKLSVPPLPPYPSAKLESDQSSDGGCPASARAPSPAVEETPRSERDISNCAVVHAYNLALHAGTEGMLFAEEGARAPTDTAQDAGGSWLNLADACDGKVGAPGKAVSHRPHHTNPL
jgi:hypothetical protein